MFCTWGDKGAAGCRLYSGTSGRPDYVSVKAIETAVVVDTVGAGDTFIAGVLYGLVCKPEDECLWADQDLERVVCFANGLAGRKVGQEGFAGLLNRTDASAELYMACSGGDGKTVLRLADSEVELFGCSVDRSGNLE